jgi:hypothetical protein
MKVYLAGEFSGDKKLVIKRRLFSYWYHHKGDQPSKEIQEVVREGRTKDLFLDSGAFSAFTQKIEIKPEDYAAYWHNVKDMFATASSLDAIGDAAKSYALLKELEHLGCKVQPVYHAREDPRWLVKYLDEGYDYIFIGGMVHETTKWLTGWLDDLFDKYLTRADGTARVKLHGFGLTTPLLMSRYPWYSVDSATWVSRGMFGECLFLTSTGLRKIVFSAQNPQAKMLDAPYYGNLSPVHQREVDRWLEPTGVTAAQCQESHVYRHIVNAQTFTAMESLGTHVFKRHQQGLF